MYIIVYLSPGLPLCRASLIHTIRPPAETGFHVCVDPGSGSPAVSSFLVVYNMASGIDRFPCTLQSFSTGPPALSGFPYTHNEASGIDRLPCICNSLKRASRSVGLPSGIPYGLLLRTVSIYISVVSTPSLPLLRFPLYTQ